MKCMQASAGRHAFLEGVGFIGLPGTRSRDAGRTCPDRRHLPVHISDIVLQAVLLPFLLRCMELQEPTILNEAAGVVVSKIGRLRV